MHKKILIKIIIFIQITFCCLIITRMYITKSIYFNIHGYESFQKKYLFKNDNYKIINFLNKNLKNDEGVIIDNSLFYYLKNKNYYWLNVNALNFLNTVSYINYYTFIKSKNIKYLVIYHDALEGLNRFGYQSDKIIETTKFYNNLDNLIIELENQNIIKKINILERNIIYEVIK